MTKKQKQKIYYKVAEIFENNQNDLRIGICYYLDKNGLDGYGRCGDKSDSIEALLFTKITNSTSCCYGDYNEFLSNQIRVWCLLFAAEMCND